MTKRHFPGCANPFKCDSYPGLCYTDPARYCTWCGIKIAYHDPLTIQDHADRDESLDEAYP